MATAIIAYARVSTDGQSLVSQQEQLKAAGAVRIYSEKISGAKTDRRQLARAIDALGKGDVLVITRLDRLARSTRDLLNILDTISRKGAAFKSLADSWADTTTAHGRLLITMLAGIAEFERELIRSRTSEGRKRAIARGVKMGRRFKLDLHQRREALERLRAGEPASQIARTFACDPTTIMRIGWRAEAKGDVITGLPVAVPPSVMRSSRRRRLVNATPH